MKTTLVRSEIYVEGWIWQPTQYPCNTTYTVPKEDVARLRDASGAFTGEQALAYVRSRWGDFQDITYLHASIEVVDVAVGVEPTTETVEVEWGKKHEEE
jgi:hypothetical protein